MFFGSDPATGYFSITPSNTGKFEFRSIYVGGTGDIRAVCETGIITTTATAGTIASNAVLTVPSGHGFLQYDVVRVYGYTVSSGTVWTGSGLYTLSAVASTTITVQGLASTGFGTLTAATVDRIGKSVLFSTVPVGFAPIQGIRIDSTGTTATNIVGLY